MGGVWADWSAPNIERLRALWPQDFTATEIAEQFGDGRTRSAIIGKAHALGLPRKPPKLRPAAMPKEPGQLSAGGVRKAFASKGDDATLTRFVKVGTEKRHRKQRRQPRLPGIGTMPYIDEGRTKFPKTVKPTGELVNLLVSGHSNVKIGRDVRKGKHRGYWIYTLSLEERKTCPSSCRHWQTCYGNNMPWAQRVDHTDPDFLPELEAEITRLLSVKNRVGVLIRLHALGDFFSIEYVEFWMGMLRKHANLAIYGYTARHPVTPIGDAVWLMNRRWPDRCMIRFSDGQLPEMSTVSIGDETGCPPNAFICPEQTGKTRCCATCGACWSGAKNVAFMEH
jgi:hypothetical protein